MVLALAIHTVSNCSAKVCTAPNEPGRFCQGPYSGVSWASYSNDTLNIPSAYIRSNIHPAMNRSCTVATGAIFNDGPHGSCKEEGLAFGNQMPAGDLSTGCTLAV